MPLSSHHELLASLPLVVPLPLCTFGILASLPLDCVAVLITPKFVAQGVAAGCVWMLKCTSALQFIYFATDKGHIIGKLV